MNAAEKAPRAVVFHRGGLGDVVLAWPILRALAAAGRRVALVSDGEKARLTGRELGVEGVDLEQPRFNALWREAGGAAAQHDVDLVVSSLAAAGSVWAQQARRMFPAARFEFIAAPIDRAASLAWSVKFAPSSAAPGSSPVAPPQAGPIVLHVGAGSEAKRWPMDRWARLAETLPACHPSRSIGLIAGETELDRMPPGERAIFERLNGRFVTSLEDLASTLRGASLFIGADSGPGHLAAQLGVRTLSLFGPTDPACWAPIGPAAAVIAPPDPAPMTWLEQARVAEAVAELWAVDRAGPTAHRRACSSYPPGMPAPNQPDRIPPAPIHADAIQSVRLIVGLEVHVELATRTKMFSRAPNPAHPDFDAAEPNTLIDATVLALPGALPVMNKDAVELSIMAGLALNCTIAPFTKWDRKSYFYPDLPKAYQLSQYDLPLCFDGAIDLPAVDETGQFDLSAEPRRIGIIRAHLEEDAGKLLHEAPGGGRIDGSIVDLNRAGTPLLEIVTQPDFDSAEQVVAFARMLRNICRALGVTEGVMQKGHMRFEPNINTVITLDDGRQFKTPVVEIKNLNSFKSVRAAIEYEYAQQPRRWLQDGKVMGPGAKTTRGWDDQRNESFLQREKEDAHDYRYFPDPDLPPVTVSEAWRERLRARVPELPLDRYRRYVQQYDLSAKEAAALTEERFTSDLYDHAVEDMTRLHIERPRAARLAANFLLQAGAKRANESGRQIHDLGIAAPQVAALAKLREDGKINANAADELFGLMCDATSASGGDDEAGSDGAPRSRDVETASGDAATALAQVESLAQSRGLLIVKDDAAMDRWIDQAIVENAQAAADVRAGKQAAIGRIVGAVMKLAGGSADAKHVREAILKKLSR